MDLDIISSSVLSMAVLLYLYNSIVDCVLSMTHEFRHVSALS